MKYFLIFLVLVFSQCKTLDPQEPGNLVAKTVEDDPGIPALRLSGTTLHVKTFGNRSKAKVFVLEGGPGDDFKYMLPLLQPSNGWSLADEHFVVFHDYRGCGLSQRHPMKELTMAASLHDLEELVDYYAKGEKVVLLGHSHGGMVAVQYANAHPERIAGLILLEPGGFSSQINENSGSTPSVKYFRSDLNKLLWIKQLIGMNNHQEADYVYDLAKINLKRENRGTPCEWTGYRSGAAAAISVAINEVEKTDYNFTGKLEEVKSPVLFISSSQTQDIGYDFQEKYHRPFFANSKHVKIANTGHDGIVNCKASESLTHIRQFFEEDIK